jgi:hypothetical protein
MRSEGFLVYSEGRYHSYSIQRNSTVLVMVDQYSGSGGTGETWGDMTWIEVLRSP